MIERTLKCGATSTHGMSTHPSAPFQQTALAGIVARPSRTFPYEQRFVCSTTTFYRAPSAFILNPPRCERQPLHLRDLDVLSYDFAGT
jgi:hypothetical protein